MENHGITIYLIQNDNVDLKEILYVIGEQGKEGIWKLSDVDCIGNSAETFHKISDERKQISGKEFYKLCLNIIQTIEGEFEFYKKNETSSWILIRAIDGTEIDIETKDSELLKKFRSKFNGVIDLVY